MGLQGSTRFVQDDTPSVAVVDPVACEVGSALQRVDRQGVVVRNPENGADGFEAGPVPVSEQLLELSIRAYKCSWRCGARALNKKGLMCHLHIDFAVTIVMPGFGVCLCACFAWQKNKQCAFLQACPSVSGLHCPFL